MEYHDISSKFVSRFLSLVEESNNIAITGHVYPDDDSLSSVLAINFLIHDRFLDKNVKMIYTGEPDPRFVIFKDYDKINFVKDIAENLQDIDLLIMLDGGNYHRFSFQENTLRKITHTICIDHHSSTHDQYTLSLICPQIPACSEIIYRAFFADTELDKDLAKIFLWGILGDTGNLSYLKPSQNDTLTIAKKLLDITHIEIQEFQARYRSTSTAIFAIVGELIKNTRFISIPGWPPLQYSYLDRQYIEKNLLSDSQVLEAGHLYSTQFIRNIADYTWGFVFYPVSNGNVVVYCRSLSISVNVRDLMERMGIGGGHDRASGGMFPRKDKNLDVYPCINSTLNWIRHHDPVLG